MDNRKKTILFTKEEIKKEVERLGNLISNDYKDKDLVIISLLNGAFIFTADLVREITVPVEIDFMTTSSYGHGEHSTGNVEIVSDLNIKIEGRDVLIVDDIIDSGYTMERVINHLRKNNPKSIKVCTMLDKPSRRKVDLDPDYVGYSIEDLFIVGYGLNYGDHYRNIPYIFSFDD